MTDKHPRSQPERSRTIPDGGLAESGLPDWMQTKPEWSARPVNGDLQVMDARPIPAEDTSTIDLASILTAQDLPDWLRAVAHRPVSAEGVREEPAPNTLPVSGMNGPSVDATGPESQADPGSQPWWTSDRIMASLLIAVILTILFVLFTTIRLG